MKHLPTAEQEEQESPRSEVPPSRLALAWRFLKDQAAKSGKGRERARPLIYSPPF